MSTTLEETEALIRAAIEAPKRARVDNVDMTQASLPEQIAAAKYLASVNATRDPRKAFTMVKIVPPGTA